MHIHILGICGTFMGGVAQLAAQAGHTVTGCDRGVYPPMSDALRASGIALTEGYGAEQLSVEPDLWVVGNAVSRGNPLLEAILNRGLPYTSGPQWMCEHILAGRHVLAVAGTHGKTTTTSLLAWILRGAGIDAGYLIGGVPAWGAGSALLGDPKAPFVIEADEYDTCFFDKRSKFVHYRPRTAILNNLEYDHADIFENLAAIEKQFHHLVRTMPSEGTVVTHAGSEALERVLAMGVWSKVERFDDDAEWSVTEDGVVRLAGEVQGELRLPMSGRYNRLNALAAVAAARTAGVSPETSLRLLADFPGVKRRQEVRGVVRGITVIDDFAHHPTAIAETIRAVREKASGRILAVLEPRSNTMKLGTMKDRLAASLRDADKVFCYRGPGVSWDPAAALKPLGEKVMATADFEALVAAVLAEARSGDTILCMSNGAFGGIHNRLLEGLGERS